MSYAIKCIAFALLIEVGALAYLFLRQPDFQITLISETKQPGFIPEATTSHAYGQTQFQDAHDVRMVGSILMRPLFALGRRPPKPPAPPIRVLPRLAGIIITAKDKKALFSPSEGKTVVLREKGIIGEYVILKIEPEQIMLLRSDEVIVLKPAFDLKAYVPPIITARVETPTAPARPLYLSNDLKHRLPTPPSPSLPKLQ